MNKPPKKKWRMMMALKAKSNGSMKNRQFKGYRIPYWGFAKKGWPEN